MIKPLVFLTLLFSYANAQVDSLKEFLQYYPLQIDNCWEYKTDIVNFPFSYDSSAYSIHIIGDTLLSNGHTYKILLHENIYPDHNSYLIFERVDSSTGCVYRFTDEIDTLSINLERKIDSLFAHPGDEIDCSRSGWTSWNYYRTLFQSADSDTILGVPTHIRKMFDISFIPGEGYVLAKGFGLYSSEIVEFSGSYTWLVYARVQGVEYGNKIIVGIKDHVHIPDIFGLFQNYPNPFNPSTTIQFSLPKTTYVTLNIYTSLGQEVTRLVSENMNAGTYTKEWNATGFASGIYYCRLEAGSFVDTKKLVLMR